MPSFGYITRKDGDRMESIFMEVVKVSPILGLLIIFWYYQRKDYKDLIDKVQMENGQRENNYQNIISKLTDKINIMEDVKKDVEEIKDKIFK